MARGARGALLAALLLLGASCAGHRAASPEQIAAAERRLLAPYVQGGEVGCQELIVDVSPNLVAHVSQPAVDVRLHSASKNPGADFDETVWINKTGAMEGRFFVQIGETDEFTEQGHVQGRGTVFLVTNAIRLRVHHRGPMRLDCEAKGSVLVLRDGDRFRDLTEFRIEDGRRHQK
ncbi:MAG: hypothetical protein Fur0037_12420 [Planctomycetota bacterium]